ncbi:MAG: ferrochelatase [Planctomycetaceae bacterium]|nr:ferrochelatase [Planctomycetaceae bacterium]
MSESKSLSYDAVLLVSFGGPNGPDDVIPFLENVLRGKNVPRERLLEVAEHYYHFGGVSPINQQNLRLKAALEQRLQEVGPQLNVYWGNRNWHPLLADTLQQMKADGVTRCLALMTSAFSCYSGCRQYREDLAKALEQVGGGIVIHKVRVFFNHPGFIQPTARQTEALYRSWSPEQRSRGRVLFCAHSIPNAMANGSAYEVQLREASRLVAEQVGIPESQWELVFQSRSGPPTQPWLEPDICDRIRQLHSEQQLQDVLVVPIGFVSDHLEVLYDLDTEAKSVCEELRIGFLRAATVGSDPEFVAALVDLIRERTSNAPRLAIGQYPANHDFCPLDCCWSGRPGAPQLPTVAGLDQAGT